MLRYLKKHRCIFVVYIKNASNFVLLSGQIKIVQVDRKYLHIAKKMEPNSNKPKLSITGIMIQDPVDMGYTAYFAELPEVIAEGGDVEEAKRNLFDALRIMFEVKKQELGIDTNFKTGSSRIESFELELI